MSGSLKSAIEHEPPRKVEISYSGYKELLVEKRERVLIVKFNRPAARNALNRSTHYELIRILHDVKYDQSIAIVVLTGVGDAFTAGNDLNQTANDAATVRAPSDDIDEMLKIRFQLNRQATLVLRTLFRAIVLCPKILVALVNGPAVGIGFTLAAVCDIVYCTENAYFQAPFTSLGICPEFGSSFSLPNILGRAKSSEVLLFGKTLTATEAYQFGLVAQIFKGEELDKLFWPHIFKYALLPAESLESSKRLLTMPTRASLLQALSDECAVLQNLRLSKIHLNAIDSFFQKRKQNKSKL